MKAHNPNQTIGIQRLREAVNSNEDEDGLALRMSPDEWEVLASYLQPVQLLPNQVLIKEGADDRDVYFVESGTLTVFAVGEAGKSRLATVHPGSCVGEGSFLTPVQRRATVQADNRCTVWTLSLPRFKELSVRRAPLALQLALALGATLSRRFTIRSKRSAVT